MTGRYEILIPTHDNAGEPFGADAHEDFEILCMDTFNGFSVNPAAFRGVWRDPETGIVYDETMTMYYVYSESDDTVTRLAEMAATIYDQVAISVTKPGGISVLVYNLSLREAVA